MIQFDQYFSDGLKPPTSPVFLPSTVLCSDFLQDLACKVNQTPPPSKRRKVEIHEMREMRMLGMGLLMITL